MSDLIWTPTSERLAGFDWWTPNEHGYQATGIRDALPDLPGNVFPGVLWLAPRNDHYNDVVSLLSDMPIHKKFTSTHATNWLRDTPAAHLRGEVFSYPIYARYLQQVTKEGRLINA